MKTIDRYRAMEQSCRQHAQLDKTTADRWSEEAELWSALAKVEHRLQLLGKPLPLRPLTKRPLTKRLLRADRQTEAE